MQLAYCRIRKAREDMTPRSPLVAGAWSAQVHRVYQVWKVFCYSYTPTLFSSGLITTWRAAERFFAEFFDFLFDNTSWCYLVVASFFPYSCALLLLFVLHVYALVQFSVYCASFTLVLHLDSQSKINLAVIFYQGSKQLLCIHTISSFQLGRNLTQPSSLGRVIESLVELIGLFTNMFNVN